ncbi:cysteine synthase A [Vulcanibacillus modesticaldus]|uniref:Cysteine synthase n=1 Tax=Vulcanibacillus modesticaldus TaxID=337097 RepID=A0A1D2YSP9_9BACI|nr:cysteine synthase A [Vulcanibacillus modesticaldus]OEF97789.1 cysteine synthase A [Vulcanibacillus modesticaldus]
MNVAENIAKLIGNTPIVKLKSSEDSADIYVKLEYYNPGGSVKDRIALQMIEDAETAGIIKPGDTIIEATSGNTGIGLAMIAAAKGYKTILVMPETMSIERRNLLRAYGAELILTPGTKGMKGAIEKTNELVATYGYFPLRQFENPSNPKAHRLYTAQEILRQMDGKIDAFVAGIGTGGTITGVGEVLKEHSQDIFIVGVEPKDSPVLSGGNPGPHKIQGIGAGFIPKILNTSIYDEIFQVTTEQAMGTAREIAKGEGILGGISTGAAIYAAKVLAKRLGKGKNIVTIAPSYGERYLSTPLYSFED